MKNNNEEGRIFEIKMVLNSKGELKCQSKGNSTLINEIKDFELNKDTVEIVNALENILAEREQREEHKKKIIEIIENSIEATGNSDVYTTGMSNGLIYIKSVITGIEPDYLECPKQDNIPVQKVKDVLDRLHISDIEPWSIYKVSGDVLFDLKELLEDK